jgi:hypothetical protein
MTQRVVAAFAAITAIGLTLLGPGAATAASSNDRDPQVRLQPPPDEDDSPEWLYPCGPAYDQVVMEWPNGWWICEYVAEDDPPWQWEYLGRRNPNTA